MVELASDTGVGRGGAFLVGPYLSHESAQLVEAHLDELASLASTSGFEDAGRAILPVRKISPATYIGSGQLEDVAAAASACGARVVIVDTDLSPVQVRNIEKACNLPVVDRAGVIIDIFAQHARSREARTQVEMAQLQYLLPRLAGRWAHLSRQVGGGPGGTKGEGEKQIELDRRMIGRRIDHLRRELTRVDRARATRRRPQQEAASAALVGYTNVGKSTLFNALTHAGVHVQDQLFATLDPTVRRVAVGKRGTYLLKDTVGFIRKLPHHLVASFRSTFEEAGDSSLLVLVSDPSHPIGLQQRDTAMRVIEESGLGDLPRLNVYNKCDRLLPDQRRFLLERDPEAILVSARTGAGLEQLSQTLADRLIGRELSGTIYLPLDRGDVLAEAHRLATVDAVEHDGDRLRVTLRAPRSVLNQLQTRLMQR
jgi:GTP-binding protein HflX